jgi:uncharacterized damage-inducible protein DinB
MPTAFLRAPGRSGAFGALMDEYARAAEDFCRVVEGEDAVRFVAERPGETGLRSRRDVCAHVCASARLYADLVRKVRGMDHIDAYEETRWSAPSPADVRGLLADALRYTEEAVEGLHELQEQAVQAMVIRSQWTSTYDPESILEHAIVHVLRHRRQLERW